MSEEIWDLLNKVGVITGIIAFFVPIITWVYNQISKRGKDRPPKTNEGTSQTPVTVGPQSVLKNAGSGIARGCLYGAMIGAIGFGLFGAVYGVIIAIREGQADAVGLVASVAIGAFWAGILGVFGLGIVGALMGIIVGLNGTVDVIVGALMGVAFSLIVDVTGNTAWNGIAGVISGAILAAMLKNYYAGKQATM
ncbi:MAG: hypothetical protein H6654_16640 [Ardenticatenaceae bacterium]|nr:hypothetical protein [Anaerolineales bacterium]MCB8939726.1 hypothetical protein [Ardenticatenaceae bacterium]MCB8975189.1 hypothetical protein [Ardenticatenaceae bacterium]